jgi:protein CpxP
MKKLFLSAAFIGLGTFAMAQHTQPSGNRMNHGNMKQNMEMHQEKQLDKMKSDLNLNDDQVMKIKAMQKERMKDMQNRMSANKAAKMEDHKDAREEMKKILTPEQYSKWETHMKEKMEKNREKRMMKKGGTMKSGAMPMESK